jgi:hypothetical protein
MPVRFMGADTCIRSSAEAGKHGQANDVPPSGVGLDGKGLSALARLRQHLCGLQGV